MVESLVAVEGSEVGPHIEDTTRETGVYVHVHGKEMMYCLKKAIF